MFYMLLPSLAERTRYIRTMNDLGVNVVFHYTPLNRSEAAARLGARGSAPVTESVSDRLVRLPFFNSLGAEDQATVIAATRAFSPSVPV